MTKKLLCWLIVTCSIVIRLVDTGLAIAQVAETSQAGAVTDFVVFWAPSRLLLRGGNPFSPAEVFELQRQIGFSGSKPDLMWNPPWTLSFVLPFGAMDFSMSHFVWLLAQAFFIVISAAKLGEIYGQSKHNSKLRWMITLTLVPTWLVLIIGQISPLVLLGATGFLYFEKTNRPFWAGASSALIAVKPHLMYLFWIAVLFWTLRQRRWQVAFGGILAIATTAAIPAIIDPEIYSQFIDMYRFPGRTTPFELPAPSLGSLLTLYVPHGNTPIQFLPPMVGVLWFLWHWQRHKTDWRWSEQLPLMILVSLTLSAYAWTYDLVVLLPAVFHGVTILDSQNRRWQNNPIVLLYLGINATYFVSKLIITTDIFYFWLAPAFLATYLTLRADRAKGRIASVFRS